VREKDTGEGFREEGKRRRTRGRGVGLGGGGGGRGGGGRGRGGRTAHFNPKAGSHQRPR